jgi:hypothetical protein
MIEATEQRGTIKTYRGNSVVMATRSIAKIVS